MSLAILLAIFLEKSTFFSVCMYPHLSIGYSSHLLMYLVTQSVPKFICDVSVGHDTAVI